MKPHVFLFEHIAQPAWSEGHSCVCTCVNGLQTPKPSATRGVTDLDIAPFLFFAPLPCFSEDPMLIVFFLLSVLRTRAAPTSSFGPHALPYAPHSLVFGRLSSSGCDSDATGRTLIDITRSCILTIAACVYRAIHPNIPNPEASRWKVHLERFQVTLLALIAPELVIFWAIRQWLGARLIKQDMDKVITEKGIQGSYSNPALFEYMLR